MYVRTYVCTHTSREHLQLYILKGDVPSCYLSEYKQRHGNPYKGAYLWDNFPLSKKLVSLALETIVKPLTSQTALTQHSNSHLHEAAISL